MENFKLLIVEDDPIMSFLQKELIRKNGISDAPECFKNGKEALDYMTTAPKKNSYLVLLDLNMPVMNGWDFLDQLEETEVVSRTKVVIVTSSVNKQEREKAREYPVVKKYLTKPLLDCTPIVETAAKF